MPTVVFGVRRRRATVTCIACGARRPRAEAREYDKCGDRWDRREKTFEYLCRDCHRELCHQPRRGLEAALVAADAGTVDRSTFLARFRRVTAGAESPERD